MCRSPAPAIRENRDPGDLGGGVEPHRVREEAHHVTTLERDQTGFAPHRASARGATGLLTEVVRKGQNDPVTRRRIAGPQRPDLDHRGTLASRARTEIPQAGREVSSMAARTLEIVRSRPSSAMDSGSGGETSLPVTAARIGCHAFVRERLSRS